MSATSLHHNQPEELDQIREQQQLQNIADEGSRLSFRELCLGRSHLAHNPNQYLQPCSFLLTSAAPTMLCLSGKMMRMQVLGEIATPSQTLSQS